MLTFETLAQCAQAAGLDAVGVASSEYLEEDDRYLQKWVEARCNGSMSYMERNKEKRTNPSLLVEGTKSVVVGLLNYYKEESLPQGVPYIALSGRSTTDYHIAMRARLQQLEILLQASRNGQLAVSEKQHIFCDSAPLLERRWAERAGLGWIGKNHLLIHPRLGSFVHIGILLLSEEVLPYSTPQADQCGDCHRCLNSCPTGALRAPLFDARKCLSYLTIERKEPLEAEYEEVVSKHLYGCDTCQRVCPYNKGIPVTQHQDLQTNPLLLTMTKEDWKTCSRRQKLKILHRLAHSEDENKKNS